MAKMIVEVSALVDFDEMDHEDLNEDGQCAVDGTYGMTLKQTPEEVTSGQLIEAALDAFHRRIGISTLDHFDVIARPANEHDTPDHDLGDITYEPSELSNEDLAP